MEQSHNGALALALSCLPPTASSELLPEITGAVVFLQDTLAIHKKKIWLLIMSSYNLPLACFFSTVQQLNPHKKWRDDHLGRISYNSAY